MTASGVSLAPIASTDLPYVEALLARNDLPTADVRSKSDCFFVAARHGERVGIGGLEVHGPDALLRSVVVEASARGEGIGTGICDQLEGIARERGVETVYLLTTTAAGFFGDRGYERIEREGAPGGIAATAEFAELCPSTATCMRKSV